MKLLSKESVNYTALDLCLQCNKTSRPNRHKLYSSLRLCDNDNITRVQSIPTPIKTRQLDCVLIIIKKSVPTITHRQKSHCF